VLTALKLMGRTLTTYWPELPPGDETLRRKTPSSGALKVLFPDRVISCLPSSSSMRTCTKKPGESEVMMYDCSFCSGRRWTTSCSSPLRVPLSTVSFGAACLGGGAGLSSSVSWPATAAGTSSTKARNVANAGQWADIELASETSGFASLSVTKAIVIDQ